MLDQRWRHLDKSYWVWVLAIVVLVFLVVNPLLRLLVVSFQDATGAFTLANYVAAYSRVRQLEALVNSLILGTFAGGLCLAFGVPMAWALSRTDMPFKGVVWVLDPRHLHHPALPRRRRLDPAGRPQRRLAQPRGRRVDRAPIGAVQHLLHDRPGAGRRAATASRTCSCSPSRRSTWCPRRWRTPPTSWARATGAPPLRSRCRWCMPAILGAFILVFLEAIALFGSPALIGTARTLPRGDDAAVAVLRIPAARGRGIRLRDAAAGHHHRCCSGCSGASLTARAMCR